MTNRINTRAWRHLRLRILTRDNWTCHYCGCPADTVDHLLERKRGGTNDEGNLVAACDRCNRGREVLGAQPAAMRRLFDGGAGENSTSEEAGEARRRPLSPLKADQPLLTGDFTRRPVQGAA